MTSKANNSLDNALDDKTSNKVSLIENLPLGWLQVSIGEILTLKRGYDLPKQNRQAGNFEIYAANGVVGTHKQSMAKAPGVVTGRSGTIGKVHYVTKDYWPLNTALYVQDFKGNDPKFIAWLLRKIDLIQFSSSSAVPTLNRNTVHQGITFLPPLKEQTRIVTALESLQQRGAKARTLLTEVEPLIDMLRQSILQSAFSGRLTADWRVKNPDVEPADQLLARIRVERRQRWEDAELAKFKAKGKTPTKGWRDKYKEPEPVDKSGLPELPEGWCWVFLPEVGYMNRGKSRHRPRNAEHLYGGVYPFVQTGDIAKSDGYVTSHTQTYSEAGLKQSKLWQEGTVCITIAANIASSAILTYPACFPDSVVGLLPDNDVCASEFVEFFIRTAKENLDRFAPSTAQKNINLSTLSSLAIPIPPRAESEEIVRRLLEAMGMTTSVYTANRSIEASLDQLNHSILSKAFRGELVPQDPNDEPASELLARIQAASEAGASAKKVSNKKNTRKKKKASP